ncbi:MAG: response regulator [Candidatus Omnitrophota bacterium]
MSKILITDDDRALVRLLAERLRAAGYEILEAYDGNHCLETARREKPDAILLDIYMPIMDGFEALKAIKADPVLKQIPILIFSGKVSSEHIKKAETLGADDIIFKSTEILDLITRLKKALKT